MSDPNEQLTQEEARAMLPEDDGSVDVADIEGIIFFD